MRLQNGLMAVVVLCVSGLVWAQAPAAADKPAESRIAAVTVYQNTALITRAVQVPGQKGQIELIVSTLPPSTINSSLYSEASDGLRVLTTRFRTRVVNENLAEEVRKLESALQEAQNAQQATASKLEVAQQNLALLAKMESFTAASMKETTEKGELNADSVTKLAGYIMERRATLSAEVVELQQALAEAQKATAFAQRQYQQSAAGGGKQLREAVIVVDNAEGKAGTVSLNYLVSAASWRPQYKLRASQAVAGGAGEDKAADQVMLEYMAAIYQRSGEDWNEADITLSTAQPQLNAAPPDLGMLEISTVMSVGGGGSGGAGKPGQPQMEQKLTINGKASVGWDVKQNRVQSGEYQEQAQHAANMGNLSDANVFWNDAAAVAQADELLNSDRDAFKMEQGKDVRTGLREGQSVTFHLDRKLTVPWRDEEQLIEVTRISMKADYFHKAVPVVTPHVYRLARLVNDSKTIILPGEATMYLGSDFVGRAELPMVAIGAEFTAGFGVDPQLAVTRTLVEKTRTEQGGNQVHDFQYRISLTSYKSTPAKVQVWDRMPHSEATQVNVTLLKTDPKLSDDPAYLREDRPRNLLRWDMQIAPNQAGENAATINYVLNMEYAKVALIGNVMTK